MSQSLVLVDIQNDYFPGGAMELNGMDAAAARAGETVIRKHFPNAFRDSTLGSALGQAGARELVIVNAMSHMCIDATTRAAFDLGYSCTVLADACATRDPIFDGAQIPAAQVHASFMAALSSPYAQVIATDVALRD